MKFLPVLFTSLIWEEKQDTKLVCSALWVIHYLPMIHIRSEKNSSENCNSLSIVTLCVLEKKCFVSICLVVPALPALQL